MASKPRVARALVDSFTFRTTSPFVCRSCRHQALRQRITLLQQSRSASGQPLPFTEKLRRKIWGTDNPPGLKDPYGGPSFLERRRMEKEARESGRYLQPGQEGYDRGSVDMVDSRADYAEEPREYVPAETWDGLEHMGHKVSISKKKEEKFEGHWADLPPKPEDSYEAFNGQAVLSLRNKEDVTQCLSRVMGEVTALGQDFPTGALDVQNPATFQILKRFTQLSGYRVKDPMISKSKTWEVLIEAIAKDVGPKSKNIAETLLMKENLAHLPNLKIMGRRETPVDKEKEIGRWKVIEAELEERGLPVLGKVTS